MFYFYKSFFAQTSENRERFYYCDLCFGISKKASVEIDYSYDISLYNMSEEQFTSEFEVINEEDRQWIPVKI